MSTQTSQFKGSYQEYSFKHNLFLSVTFYQCLLNYWKNVILGHAKKYRPFHTYRIKFYESELFHLTGFISILFSKVFVGFPRWGKKIEEAFWSGHLALILKPSTNIFQFDLNVLLSPLSFLTFLYIASSLTEARRWSKRCSP